MSNGTLNSSPGGARRTWITTLVILLVIFLAVGAYVELRPRRIRISVVKPIRQEVSSSITTNGKVEPIHGFEAHAPLAGTVQKVLVKEGDQRKGRPVARSCSMTPAPAATWPPRRPASKQRRRDTTT